MSDNLWFLENSERPTGGAPPTAPPAAPPGGGGYAQSYSQAPSQSQNYTQGPAASAGEAASFYGATPSAIPSQGTPYNQGPPQGAYNQGPPQGVPPQGAYGSPQGTPYGQGPPQGAYNQGPPQGGYAPPQGAPSSYGSQVTPYGGAQPGYGQPGPENRGFFNGQQQQFNPDQNERGLFSHKNPIDPPPPEFSRPPPGHYTYIQFAPVSVLANTERLQDGFAMIPPPARAGDQHPFASHDITQEDWHKFLKDLEKVAHLSPSERLFSSMNNSFLANKITSESIQRRMRDNHIEPIGDYLMAWNQYYFHPRRMSVVLAMGRQRYSGETEDVPPDLRPHVKPGKSGKSHNRSNSDSDSSSSDSDSDHGRHGGGGGRRRGDRGDRMARRQERREARRERLQSRLGSGTSHSSSGSHGKHDKHDKHHKEEEYVEVYVPDNRYRLVLCFWDGSREIF